RCWLINQYCGTGSLAGIPGEIDLNRSAAPIDVLTRFIGTGTLDSWVPSTVVPIKPATPPALGTRTLRLHAIGADVRALQTRLGQLGITVDVDGDYGPE